MNLDNLPILSMLIWLPILGGIWTLIIGDQQERVVKHFSFIISISTFLLSVLLYYQFDNDFLGMQFVEEFYWIESFSIKYHLGVDGIALPLIILTTFTTILVIVAAWEVIDKNISYYMCSFLVLTGLMNGVFVALDSILFYKGLPGADTTTTDVVILPIYAIENFKLEYMNHEKTDWVNNWTEWFNGFHYRLDNNFDIIPPTAWVSYFTRLIPYDLVDNDGNGTIDDNHEQFTGAQTLPNWGANLENNLMVLY